MRPAGEGAVCFLLLRTKLHHGEGDARRSTLDALDYALENTGWLVGTAYRRQLAADAGQRRRRRFEDGRNLTDWARLRSMEMVFDEAPPKATWKTGSTRSQEAPCLSDGPSKSPARGGVAL